MTSVKLATSKIVSFEDLRTLAAATGPCVTIALEIPNPAQVRTEVKNAVRDIEKRIAEKRIGDADLKPEAANALLEPIHTLAATLETEGDWGIGMDIYRSPGLFRYFFVPAPVKQFVTIDNQFQIRPLLQRLSRPQEFFLLALSEKHVRLFRCTFTSAEEVPLPPTAPHSLENWLSLRGILHNTTIARERASEYLPHFFKDLDKSLHPMLVNQTAPLILAAVETEIPIYRHENSYPHFMENALHGSPDSLTPRELHQRALAVVKGTFSAELQKANKELEQYRGTNRVSFDLPQILKWAHEGRVSHLLLREEADQRGRWDADAEQVQPGNEDLLNLAAIATLLHRGEAFGLPTSEMPDADAAAVLRF